MKILIAEDDRISRQFLATRMTKWGYEVGVTQNGNDALDFLLNEQGPVLALLDWMMPGLDGLQVCKRVRVEAVSQPYIIILTARVQSNDIVEGLAAGANDYVTKPPDQAELKARIEVGSRMLELQGTLARRVKELEEALSQVRDLHGILPICLHCKKIRDDRNYWQQVEAYISAHSHAQFSHSICPDCYENIEKPGLDRWLKDEQEGL